MAHTGQSRPDSGLGFKVKFLKPHEVVPRRPVRGVAGGLWTLPDIRSQTAPGRA